MLKLDKSSIFICGSVAAVVLLVASGCNGGGGNGGNNSSSGGTTTASNSAVGNGQVFKKAYEYQDVFGHPAPMGSPRKAPTAPGVTVTGDTIKIGIVGSLTGPQAPWGKDEIAGAKLAVDDFNKSGKLKGKTVQLDIGDSASKPEIGKSAADKLLSDGCIALEGEVASGITLPMAQEAFDKGVPIVAVGATRNDITNIGSNVFRVCYTDSFQGPVMATFAYKELGLRKMALITDKALPYSTGLSTSFRDYFTKLGGTIVDEEFYQSGDINFQPLLTKVKAANPDGLFMSGYFTETGPLAKQARQVGITGPLLGGDGWDSAEILTTGGDAINGAFFCNHYNNKDQRPQVQQFLKEWEAANGGSTPGTTMAALGYDAAALICDALTRSKGMDSKDLIQAIGDTENFQGVTGDITLKGYNGNPPKRAIVVELENGSTQSSAQ